MVGQEVGIYGVFIRIINEPCITWPSSFDKLTTLGYFNFVLLLFLHKTIPLSCSFQIPKKKDIAQLCIFIFSIFFLETKSVYQFSFTNNLKKDDILST